jgi:hypothetical protein
MVGSGGPAAMFFRGVPMCTCIIFDPRITQATCHFVTSTTLTHVVMFMVTCTHDADMYFGLEGGTSVLHKSMEGLIKNQVFLSWRSDQGGRCADEPLLAGPFSLPW